MLQDTKGVRFGLAPFFIAAPLLLLSIVTWAEIPVVDLGNRSVTVAPARAVTNTGGYQSTSQPTQEPLGILYEKMQALQEEVQSLRGQLEQQQNELQQLKQAQKENYLDLDKRLSELQSGNSVIPGSAPSLNAPLALPANTANQTLEKASYDAALELLNKNQKDAAALAFRKHLINYPQGEYAGNSMYWLGQIFLSQAMFIDAEDQFSALLKTYPAHRKAIDAKFSLGKVYFQQGKKAEAKKIITEVSQSDSPTAKLALDYLNNNF